MPLRSAKTSCLTVLLLGIYSLAVVYSCNEAVCASIVSKCMLLNSCRCNVTTCECCRDCFLCLSFLYDECCACFELCPKRNFSLSLLSKTSNVEDLEEPIPELFRALAEEPDKHKRWISFTYPMDIPIKLFTPKYELPETYNAEEVDERLDYLLKVDVVTVNCTVAFMAECGPWTKCKQSCQAMGANSYRWFHDGCCECIGDRCINYGVNESKCPNCSMRLRQEKKEELDDYGQDDDEDMYKDELAG